MITNAYIEVYRSFWQRIYINNYSSSLSHNYLIHALNHCYQVGQYLKHHAQKRHKILNYACEYPIIQELFFQNV